MKKSVCFAGACLLLSATCWATPQKDLIDAIQDSNPAGVKRALLAGADPNIVDQTTLSFRKPLPLATEIGDVEIVRILLKAKADPNGFDWYGSPLLQATWCRFPRVVQVLLEAGADPNAANGIGTTPLLNACHWGRADIARLLLAFKANPNLADQNGQTPLSVAKHYDDDSEIVKVLREAGAS